ncbi:MAG: S41 family peptidase [Rikenellaceae bacterium]
MKKRILLLPILAMTLFCAMAQKGDFALVRDTEIMINMLRALNERYVDTLSTSRLLSDAVSGMARNLDPYTKYIDEEEMADFELMTTGKYGGIGSLIRKSGDYVIIAQPYRGFPADEAGLMIGDKILEIDGQSIKGMAVDEVSNRLKGTPGSKLKVVVSSVVDTLKQRKVTMTRRRIAIPAVPYFDMVSDSVAYLNHSDFTNGGAEEIRQRLDELSARGMKALILDYRGNGGGVMQEAVEVLSTFVPKGSEVLKIKGRSDSTIYKTAERALYPSLPMVVMVDEGTASAAEIVAGALQDMDRAVLVGQRSFGKGLVQSTIPVGYEAYVKLTTARYYIPSGRCIQALDYSDHSEGRKVEKRVDSLRQLFYTANGRKVYDGGGVTPDVEVEAEYASRFAATLYYDSLIDEWGNDYFRRNYPMTIEDPKSFGITDEDYENFSAFVLSREVDYESEVSVAMKALERAAERELNDELGEELKQLSERLNDDVADNLARYRDHIEVYITNDLLLRYSYLDGAMANRMAQDKGVREAIEILNDVERYNSLLQPQTEPQTEE